MNVLNELFDAVYCINLDRRPDRWSQFEEVWVELLNTDIDRFQAWDAEDGIPLEAGQYREDETHSAGSVACSLSHCAVMREALNAGHDEVLIFEDDAFPLNPDTFLDDFVKYYQMLPRDYGLAYAGCFHRVGPIMINEKIGKCLGATGMHCYMFRPKVGAWMIGECLNNIDYYVQDEILGLWHAQCQMPFYSFEPMLVAQRASYSDLLGKDVDYGTAGNWATTQTALSDIFGLDNEQNELDIQQIIAWVNKPAAESDADPVHSDILTYLRRMMYPQGAFKGAWDPERFRNQPDE